MEYDKQDHESYPSFLACLESCVGQFQHRDAELDAEEYFDPFSLGKNAAD